jgi:hypothetical protein
MSTVAIALLFGLTVADYNAYDNTKTIDNNCEKIDVEYELDLLTVNGNSNWIRAKTGYFGDNIVVNGAGNMVWSGKGDDTVALSGSGNTANGGEGDDRLSAFGAGNILNGDDGDDTLTVIRDSQGTTLAGGKGHDRFVIDIASGDNRIVDFNNKKDKLILTGIDLYYTNKKLTLFVDHYSYAAALFVSEKRKDHYGEEYDSVRLIYFNYFSGDTLEVNDEHYNTIVLEGKYKKLDEPDELAMAAPCIKKNKDDVYSSESSEKKYDRYSSESSEKKGYGRRSSDSSERRHRRRSSDSSEKKGYGRRSSDSSEKGYGRSSSSSSDKKGYGSSSSSEKGYGRSSSSSSDKKGYSSESSNKKGYSSESSEKKDYGYGYEPEKDYGYDVKKDQVYDVKKDH